MSHTPNVYTHICRCGCTHVRALALGQWFENGFLISVTHRETRKIRRFGRRPRSAVLRPSVFRVGTRFSYRPLTRQPCRGTLSRFSDLLETR